MKSSLPSPSARIGYKKNTIEGILNYDIDNLYPQRMRSYYRSSGTASNCIKTYSKFIKASGFSDKVFYKSKVNRFGQTCDHLLRKVADNISEFRGFALHVNYNLLGKIVDVTHVPFEYCRLAIPDDYGYVSKVAVYDDWDKIKNKAIDKKRIQLIDRFNPNQEVILSQIESVGGIENYKGQIIWVSLDGDNQYPLAIYDSVVEDIIANAGIKTYRLRQTTTNFFASHIAEFPFEFESEQEREEQNNIIKSFQGVENSSKIMVIENPNAADPNGGLKLHKVDIQDGDKMFQITNQTGKDAILEAFSLPPVLAGVQIPGKLGNQDMSDAYTYYNMVTYDERLIVEESFKTVFENFERIINPTSNYSIIPLSYGI